MEVVPKRPNIASFYRKILSSFEGYLPLPNINPSWYEVFGLFLSFVFLYPFIIGAKIFILILILLSDWFDGATSRRYKTLSKDGYLIDLTSDRLSELVVFFPIDGTSLSWFFFFLALINVALAYLSVMTGKHKSMALRFFFLLFLIYRAWK